MPKKTTAEEKRLSSNNASSTIVVEERRGSRLTASLERVWHMLRELHPEIPPAVMTLYPVPTRRPAQNNGVLTGHFSPAAWLAPTADGQSHEVGINPLLFGNAEHVLSTLLHEAAHATLHGQVHNRDFRYHPAEFRDICQQWGLECQFHNRRYGFCITRWPKNQPPSKYGRVLRYIDKNIPAGVPTLVRHENQRQTHLLALRCKCQDSGRVIYVRRVLATTPTGILCERCKAFFRAPKAPSFPAASKLIVSARSPARFHAESTVSIV